MFEKNPNRISGTTVLALRKNGKTVIAADGQVSLGGTILKGSANKLRKIADGKIVAGFAGATADALTLFERLEAKLEKHPNQLARACVELAKDWRMDKYLRRLEAMMVVVDKHNILLLTGTGDVLEPEENVVGIGSGGNYALAAARALMDIENLEAEEIVRRSMKIAADICIYSNHNVNMEVV